MKSKLEKMADREFKKLPKKEQRRINAQRRIPTCPGTITHGASKYCKRDRKWKEESFRFCSLGGMA